MEKNVGGIDRIIRIIAGILILAAGVYFRSWWGLLGILPLGSAFARRCPWYVPLKWNTNKSQSE